MKTCPKCGQTKALDQFNRDRSKSDGKSSYCRECNRKKCAVWKYENPERKRELDRRHHQKVRLSLYGPEGPQGNKKGSSSHLWQGDAIRYVAAHARVRRARGKASDHNCVDCFHRADDWSYIGGCHRELTELRQDTRKAQPAREVTYSPDPEMYAARCRSCHIRFDMNRSNLVSA